MTFAAALRPGANPFRLLVLFCLVSLLPPQASAQDTQEETVPRATQTIAIEGARIVQAPGQVIERGTVVMRDGLILAVGRDVAVPFDAARLDGDSLVVYAGFIDGLSHVGLEKPKEQGRVEVKDPGNPPDDVAGLTPYQDARPLLKPDDGSIDKLRKAGFTAAHVVPYGNVLPGTGALVLLAGDDPNTMVLDGDLGLFARFDTRRGVYPSTPMGVIAVMRQLYREAARRQEVAALYDQNPAGLSRPAYDPKYEAFYPVVQGAKPVYFYTEGALETHRALALRQELGFDLVLAGLNESFEVVDALKEADVPLLLSLDLPEDKAAKRDTSKASIPTAADTLTVENVEAASDSAKTVTSEAPGSFFVHDFRTRSFRDVTKEKENLEARQALARQAYAATAAELHAAGLPFGFTTLEANPQDLHKNLRAMVEAGLPEDAALAALTTNAAEILGLSRRMGTVEPGKMANLVVTTGPLFEEDTKVRYVFVEGRQFKYETKKTLPANGTPVNPAGTWSFTVPSPDGDVTGTLTLTGNPGNLSGTLTADVLPEPAQLEGVELDGNELTFAFEGGSYGRITAEVTLVGDTFAGTIEVGGDSLPISGTRTDGPSR